MWPARVSGRPHWWTRPGPRGELTRPLWATRWGGGVGPGGPSAVAPGRLGLTPSPLGYGVTYFWGGIRHRQNPNYNLQV